MQRRDIYLSQLDTVLDKTVHTDSCGWILLRARDKTTEGTILENLWLPCYFLQVELSTYGENRSKKQNLVLPFWMIICVAILDFVLYRRRP